MFNGVGNQMPYVENVEEIETNGIEQSAILTSIEPFTTMTVNGENPQILTYEYNYNGQKVTSQFCVFNPEKTQYLEKGSELTIKHFNGKSTIPAFEQYTMQMSFLYYIATVVLLIGLLLCYILYLRIKPEIDLYKTGQIKEGIIISINHNSSFSRSQGTSMTIHYEYNNSVTKSRTTNHALTNSKAIGDPIRILVSKDGMTSCLYPELTAKTNGWERNSVLT